MNYSIGKPAAKKEGLFSFWIPAVSINIVRGCPEVTGMMYIPALWNKTHD
jgi:hypothetical protein